MVVIQTLPPVPRGGRLILVGDIHGCPKELSALLDHVRFAKGVDTVVIVGDFVNKGYDSAGAVRLAMSIGAYGVMGNHDMTLIHVINEIRDGVIQCTADITDPLVRTAASFPQECLDYLVALPHVLKVPQFNTIVVHAGLRVGIPLDQQNIWELLHLRRFMPDGRGLDAQAGGQLWAETWKGPELVVFGHDALTGLQQGPNYYGLDTGCVYGGALTALILPERRLVAVPGSSVPAEKRGVKKAAESTARGGSMAKNSPPPPTDVFELSAELTSVRLGAASSRSQPSNVTVAAAAATAGATTRRTGSPSVDSVAAGGSAQLSLPSPAPRPPLAPSVERPSAAVATPTAAAATAGAASSSSASLEAAKLKRHLITCATSLASAGNNAPAVLELLGTSDHDFRDALLHDEGDIPDAMWSSLIVHISGNLRRGVGGDARVATDLLHWIQDVSLEHSDCLDTNTKRATRENLTAMTPTPGVDEKLIRATMMAIR